MKKLVIAIIFAFFLATLFSSCKSQDCPAYDYQQVETGFLQ